MSSSPRFPAVAVANTRRPRAIDRPLGDDGRPLTVAQMFGRNTFNVSVMADKLPRAVYRRVLAVLAGEGTLDRVDADIVAHAVKEWALENDCTHFTHWFQPMTGSTAEKHDAFLTFDKDGAPIERFSGDALLQSEPDASSFPSGGMRTTFEARGYTAWDPSSPIFIMENLNGNTLCVPSAFVSYTGEALDKKTPLLRSMQAINTAAGNLLEALGHPKVRVVPTLGCEQEYFLIDRAYWALRPDLSINGRTVAGAQPPKGQSLDDHYFGAISPRVQAFMQEVELELYKLGVPAKTRHNEVAPSQYEIAPVFSEANVGVDHNQLVMEIMRRVAVRHDFKVIFAEKPFAGINGSGKHANWSLSAGGDNLLEPGDEPSENLRFLAVLASVLLGVYRHGGLLRASVATYGNDFRLGANEAPPAIMSVFLGELLTRICDALASGDDLPDNPQQAILELGVSSIPSVAKDNTDRNRTSPVAFTGNKFEFRAVGSDQNPAWPVTVLNTIVADGMATITEWIGEAGGGPGAAFRAIQRAIKESSPVRFEGNGYAEEWVEEAARRGLPNLRKSPEAYEVLRDDGTVALFGRHGVLAPAEVLSRYNVLSEQYATAVDIEVDCMRILVDEIVLPAALAERGKLAAGLGPLIDLRNAGIDADIGADTARLERLTALVRDLTTARAALQTAAENAHAADNHAQAACSDVLPVLESIRVAVDGLEGLVSDHNWPLPKYREMLFLV
jgi:glutamine synthetase